MGLNAFRTSSSLLTSKLATNTIDSNNPLVRQDNAFTTINNDTSITTNTTTTRDPWEGIGFNQNDVYYLGVNDGAEFWNQSTSIYGNVPSIDYGRVTSARDSIDQAFADGELTGFINEYFNGNSELFSQWWAGTANRDQFTMQEAEAFSRLSDAYYTGSNSSLTGFFQDDLGLGNLADNATAVGDAVSDGLDSVANTIGDVGDAIGDTVSTVEDTVSSILSGLDSFLSGLSDMFGTPDIPDIDGAVDSRRNTASWATGQIRVPVQTTINRGYLSRRHAGQASGADISRRTLGGS